MEVGHLPTDDLDVVTWDRVKDSFFRLVRASSPRADYTSVYRGVVVSQSGQTVDVKLDDPRLPGMSALPIQVGLPGATVEMAVGARMLVAFENGDPAKPIALHWEGAQARRISLPADLLELGGEGLTEAVVLGTTYRDAEHEMNAGPLGLAGAFDLMQAAAVGPLAPLKPGLLQAKAALEIFEAQTATFLSTTVKTK